MRNEIHPISGVQEQLARIRRAWAESDEFNAEQAKLAAEQSKLAAEQNRFVAEALKFDPDRRLPPWLAVAAISGGIGGTIAGAVEILGLTGLID